MHNMHKMHNIHRTLHNRFGLLLLGVVSMAGCATPDHTTEGAVGGGLLGGGLGALIGSASGHAGAGAAIGAGIGAGRRLRGKPRRCDRRPQSGGGRRHAPRRNRDR